MPLLVWLLRTYTSDTELCSSLIYSLRHITRSPPCKKFIERDSLMPIFLSMLNTSLLTSNILLILVHSCEDHEPNLKSFIDNGGVLQIVELSKHQIVYSQNSINCCKLLAMATSSTNVETRSIIVENELVIPLLQRLALSKGYSQLTAWAAQLIGNLCMIATVRDVFLGCDAMSILLKSIKQARKQALNHIRKMSPPDPPEGPPPPPPIIPSSFLFQMLGYTLATFIDENDTLDPNYLKESYVHAILCGKTSENLNEEQRKICVRALNAMEKTEELPSHIFLMEIPDNAGKKVTDIETIQRMQRLKALTTAVADIRKQDAEIVAQIIQQQKEEAAIEAEIQAAAQLPKEPIPIFEKSAVPKVFWHCTIPPEVRITKPIPQNPEKIVIEGLTPTSAVVKWERPKSQYKKLIYTIKISSDNATTFQVVGEPTSLRHQRLYDLHPDSIYYVTVSCRPIIDETSEEPIPAQTLAKRQQKLIRFRTPGVIRPPDRFCSTPDVISKLPPIVSRKPETLRPHSLPELSASSHIQSNNSRLRTAW
eukprot:NODE_1397_length_1977_cov_38.141855_g1186_i0.p1 GENE.NODE_1397_length_1977_cov_38.141855_g1186_i0~~NODE_1397_length_1977_cov_38.141855_g1186_i0.p1  ORF type:complete len:620 (-),score=120.59 NODE_1397_length_1977_cov_38.141855_g1186_i0:117-1727(-)